MPHFRKLSGDSPATTGKYLAGKELRYLIALGVAPTRWYIYSLAFSEGINSLPTHSFEALVITMVAIIFCQVHNFDRVSLIQRYCNLSSRHILAWWHGKSQHVHPTFSTWLSSTSQWVKVSKSCDRTSLATPMLAYQKRSYLVLHSYWPQNVLQQMGQW